MTRQQTPTSTGQHSGTNQKRLWKWLQVIIMAALLLFSSLLLFWKLTANQHYDMRNSYHKKQLTPHDTTTTTTTPTRLEQPVYSSVVGKYHWIIMNQETVLRKEASLVEIDVNSSSKAASGSILLMDAWQMDNKECTSLLVHVIFPYSGWLQVMHHDIFILSILDIPFDHISMFQVDHEISHCFPTRKI